MQWGTPPPSVTLRIDTDVIHVIKYTHRILQAIKNWTVGRPAREGGYIPRWFQ